MKILLPILCVTSLNCSRNTQKDAPAELQKVVSNADETKTPTTPPPTTPSPTITLPSPPANAAASIGKASSSLKSDETLLLRSAIAYKASDASYYAKLSAWVYEPEENSVKRNFMIKQLTNILNVERTSLEGQEFERRLRPFLYDSESGKNVTVNLGSQGWPLQKSTQQGTAEQVVNLGTTVAPTATISVELPGRDSVQATLFAPDQTAQILVSDIDDTIKVSHVGDTKALLRSTFLEPFTAVPGMAKLYSEIAAQKATQFIYLSNSPWPLYPWLVAEVKKSGFPDGHWLLRQWSVTGSILDLFEKTTNHKTENIEYLFTAFPHNKFILVGDDGELDPETYHEAYLKYSKQITKIILRKANLDPNRQTAVTALYKDVSDAQWEYR